ncbi:MAG: metal-dependent hydrolase [Proteobacteria bacterium]|nr:metal-dependent hydrolase [Pseudomonadota bacterium]
MADITVRKIRFTFEDPIDLDASEAELGEMLPALALSMTMPYLEPYLIRTMKVALKAITEPALVEDVRRFCQQEGHHYRNHALFNDQIRGQFDAAIADGLRGIEAAMEADYQRFSHEKSRRFNVAYAEGFEAMTCAGALAAAEHGAFDGAGLPGGEIWAWHMAEEIEHRTVAFDVFQHLVGSYPYRILAGAWAQWHYVSYIRRFALCMARGLGLKRKQTKTSPMHRKALRRYLHTWSPRYDPAKIEVPAGVQELLAKYSALAEGAAS